MDEINLAACELGLDGIADDLHGEDMRLGDDRLAVRRRGRDDRQVARAHERELQRARDRRRRQGQRIDVDGHLREFLLGRDAELLFLVDDQQPPRSRNLICLPSILWVPIRMSIRPDSRSARICPASLAVLVRLRYSTRTGKSRRRSENER